MTKQLISWGEFLYFALVNGVWATKKCVTWRKVR